MIRPAAFGINKETASTNFFQTASSIPRPEAEVLHQRAVDEFDNMVATLRENDIDVMVIDDTKEPAKPSAVFPNNWISTSPEGILFVYPMYAPNRRAEKREDILKMLAGKFIVKSVQDWSEFEAEGKFLEGTGSMVMDHENKVIYACHSPRTDPSVLEKFARVNGYRAILFLATDSAGQPVYHTNVVITLGEDFAVCCEESIEEEWERIAVRQLLESSDHQVISISREQMQAFAGNMLQVKNGKGEKILILSRQAYDSLTEDQKEQLNSRSRLLPVPVAAIENAEGGSVRCMMAEIFLEKKMD